MIFLPLNIENHFRNRFKRAFRCADFTAWRIPSAKDLYCTHQLLKIK